MPNQKNQLEAFREALRVIAYEGDVKASVSLAVAHCTVAQAVLGDKSVDAEGLFNRTLEELNDAEKDAGADRRQQPLDDRANVFAWDALRLIVDESNTLSSGQKAHNVRFNLCRNIAKATLAGHEVYVDSDNKYRVRRFDDAELPLDYDAKF